MLPKKFRFWLFETLSLTTLPSVDTIPRRKATGPVPQVRATNIKPVTPQICSGATKSAHCGCPRTWTAVVERESSGVVSPEVRKLVVCNLHKCLKATYHEAVHCR